MSKDLHFREFQWPLRVYIEDTDAGGIVYYVNYLKFMERARTEFLRSLGFEHYLRSDEDFMFVVAEANVAYRKPAQMDDNIVATAEIVELGRASLRFRQRIQRNDEILAEGELKIACVSKSGMKPRAIPARLLSLFQQHYGMPA
jgi:tol-pal system-associated acyl-CoA thioesterase